MIKKIKYIFIEFYDLGWIKGLFRVFYELSKKTRVLKLYDFLFYYRHRSDRLVDPINLNKIAYGKFFIPDTKKIEDYFCKIGAEEKDKILKLADFACEGKILTFSKVLRDYTKTPNFHLNPMKKVIWPNNIHFTEISNSKNLGDIKLVWEINRFPHFYHLARAYFISKNPKYITVFKKQIYEWIKQNKYPYGVNWSSGQEIAIRLFAWIYAYFAFRDELQKDTDFLEAFLKSIWWQTSQIERHIYYAYYAVHNNHLIGEAAALYIIGKIFPFFKDSKRWVKKGKKILLDKTGEQFYEDGGYCQLSHTYHRLALHYLVWVLRIAELNDDSFPDRFYTYLKKSANFLLQNMNLQTGELPNWGANDGALLNPWTNCDYADFRPLLGTLYYLTNKKRVFSPGPWDEEIFWFFGELSQQTLMVNQKSVSFSTTGIHIIRKSEKDFLVFRCGNYPDRFGQADQNHVDLWLNGKNILIDGGSYLYNDELRFHYYFMGTRSHNTVSVDGQDQMILWRRFKWLYMTEANIVKFDKNLLVGESAGYKWLDRGLKHKRWIDWTKKDSIVIYDTIFNNYQKIHEISLHYLLPHELNEEKSVIDGIKVFALKSDSKIIYFYLLFLSSNEIASGKMDVKKGYDDGKNVDGWYSRYYSEIIPATGINHKITISDSVSHVTVISLRRLTEKELMHEINAYSSDFRNA